MIIITDKFITYALLMVERLFKFFEIEDLRFEFCGGVVAIGRCSQYIHLVDNKDHNSQSLEVVIDYFHCNQKNFHVLLHQQNLSFLWTDTTPIRTGCVHRMRSVRTDRLPYVTMHLPHAFYSC